MFALPFLPVPTSRVLLGTGSMIPFIIAQDVDCRTPKYCLLSVLLFSTSFLLEVSEES